MAPLRSLEKTTWSYVALCRGQIYASGVSTAKYDPACSNGEAFHFYGKPDGKAVIWQRPFEASSRIARCRISVLALIQVVVIEHWHTGSMTRRIPVLHQAMPHAYVEFHPDDAKSIGDYAHGDNSEANFTRQRCYVFCLSSINQRGLPAPRTSVRSFL